MIKIWKTLLQARLWSTAIIATIVVSTSSLALAQEGDRHHDQGDRDNYLQHSNNRNHGDGGDNERYVRSNREYEQQGDNEGDNNDNEVRRAYRPKANRYRIYRGVPIGTYRGPVATSPTPPQRRQTTGVTYKAPATGGTAPQPINSGTQQSTTQGTTRHTAGSATKSAQ